MHLAKGPQKVFVEWKVKTFQGFLFFVGVRDKISSM